MNQQPYYEYTLKQSSQFKKDLKAVKFDEHKLEELKKVLEHLGCTGEVPPEYQPHPLKGQLNNPRSLSSLPPPRSSGLSAPSCVPSVASATLRDVERGRSVKILLG